MTKPIDIFCEVPCLTEKSPMLGGLYLQKKWFKSADKRVIGQYLQKFIDYNSSMFSFLGVIPSITGTDLNTSLFFRTSEFIGSIPLRASDNGKQIGDFVVSPRFSGNDRFEDYIEILNLLGEEISPKVADSLPLASGKNFRPPLYLEAVKFIATLETLIKTSWRKFDNKEEIKNIPQGQINWKKYVNNESKIENRVKFPTNKNYLTQLHPEYSEIKYVFEICKRELLSSKTPISIKNTFRKRIQFIEDKLYFLSAKPTSNIVLRFSDSPAVKNCKINANKILKKDFIESTAWRVDFSDVFEKFVQYIFKEASKETGGRLFANFKFHSRTNRRYSWELKHLEPDAIYQKEDLLVVIDAKYKSNLYNKYDLSEKLKEEHRHDLHQILAYSAFSKTNNKFGILCYPSDKLEIKRTTFKNGINEIDNVILILGIPLKREIINDSKRLLIQELYDIETTTLPNTRYS